MNRFGFPAVVGATAAAALVAQRFRRDLAAARGRLAGVPVDIVDTSFGAVEYADVGIGEPVLAVHGIFGGRDAGLLSFGDLLPNTRVIAPSRFGYLGSSMPTGASPARQADAFAELLDALGIEQIDVIGYSAGTPSVLQLALRHPARVRHLVVVSGAWPGARTTAPPAIAKAVFRHDLPMWIVNAVAARALLHFIAGVPTSFRFTADDRAQTLELIDTCFPVRDRGDGITFDAFIGNLDVDDYRLEDIAVPTLIVHSRDDTLAPYAPAEAAARRIPGARLVSHERGGHLMLGQSEVSRTAVSAFLRPSPAGPERQEDRGDPSIERRHA